MGLFDFLRDLIDGGSGAGGSGDDTTDVAAFGAADFRREAEEFADDHDDVDLDFTVASLARLDEFADGQAEVLDVLGDEMDDGDELTTGVRDGYVLWFGSYFGEVLVREFDGEWVTDGDGDGVHVVVPAGDGAVEVAVFDAAAVAIDGDAPFAETAAELEETVGSETGAVAAAGETASGAGSSDGDGPAADAVSAGRAAVAVPDLPAVPVDPDEDVDAAHQRAVDAFEDAGFHVTPGTLMNSVDGPLQGAAKLFNFQDGDAMFTVAVYPGEWTDEATQETIGLADAILQNPMSDGFLVLSAREPPAAVNYYTGTHARAPFALAAMDELLDGPDLAPESAERYADIGAGLLAEHVGVDVDVDDVEALETLDGVVLDELRPVDDHQARYDGYVPEAALAVVGALAGRVMRRAFEREHGYTTEWADGAGVSSTGVALTVADADGEEMTVNPVGKAFKLFENGDEDSLAYMYEVSVAAMEDEL